MKRLLRSKVAEQVEPKALKDTLSKAYAKAAPLLITAVHNKYPEVEMKVLRKYNHVNTERNVRFLLPDGGVEQFIFDEDMAVDMPSRVGYFNTTLIPAVTGVAHDAIMAWSKAYAAYNAEYSKRTNAYDALIESATYLEDLLEVWPEAASLVPNNGMLIALGPDQIALIKADRKERGL
jgi:hypothetical protein